MGGWARKAYTSHLTRTQNKAQGPLEEPIMANVDGVNLEPYHNKPNPKIGVAS